VLRWTAGALVLGAAFVAVAIPPGAEARPKQAALIVSLGAPRGVAASVSVRAGARRSVVAKPARGTARRVTLPLRAGRYVVEALPVTWRGRLYVPRVSQRRVRVGAGRRRAVRVRYRRVAAAANFRPTLVTGSSVRLSWSVARKTKVMLRRVSGRSASVSASAGKRVRVRGRSAVDRGLREGRAYGYALFTRAGGHWIGPTTVVVGTTPPSRSRAAAYVAAPDALLLSGRDIRAAQATGSGVRVRLAARVAPPVIGAPVVLPPSRALPGGYLGQVVSIATDGALALRPTGLSRAFSYLNIRTIKFSTGARPLTATRAALAPRNAPMGRASALPPCEPGVGGELSNLSLASNLELSGDFSAKINTTSVWFVDVPNGASVDMSVKATAQIAATSKGTTEATCGYAFRPVMTMLVTSPVPIALRFEPTAEAYASKSRELAGVGARVTAGARIRASIDADGLEASADPILDAAPLTPQITRTGELGVRLKGSLTVGPGVGSTDAGVIAGVEGELTPLAASATALFPPGDSRRDACLKLDAKAALKLSFAAKAWLGPLALSGSRKVWDGELPFSAFGAPWYLPANCERLAPKAGDSIVGDGVERISDTTSGAPEQWQRVEGFVPGSQTWVLSTGRVEDAVGPPDYEASTALGQPGDTDLTALAGYETRDAAAYQVTVIPRAPHLHVKYAFASEEYPEYVGDKYNDVMAVYVNGHNCATVPGTGEPVSVNTINADSHPDLWVDNAEGAAGYGTSMDGLTRPLTCTTNVTPGQPVTVRIAVADSSDEDVDSAVALLDRGIWAD